MPASIRPRLPGSFGTTAAWIRGGFRRRNVPRQIEHLTLKVRPQAAQRRPDNGRYAQHHLGERQALIDAATGRCVAAFAVGKGSNARGVATLLANGHGGGSHGRFGRIRRPTNGENFNTHSGPGDRRAEQSQKAPASFLGMLQGKNFGKTLVRVAAQGINGAGGDVKAVFNEHLQGDGPIVFAHACKT
jgi:hypothetical protein